jgi:predicted dehydrogenase
MVQASHSSPPATRPRVALIGVSGYGSVYLALARAARNRQAIDLVAAVVINPAEEQANEEELVRHGCRIYRDYETMLKEQQGRIDLCLIPTGIQWHARMTVAALQAGAQVLVEKPLAGSLTEVSRIREVERTTGRWVAVGFQDIYCPTNQWLKGQLCAGAIGRLHSVRLLGSWPRPTAYFTRNHWAGRLQADGAPVRDSLLNNAFAHFVNLCLYFAGREPAQSASVSIESAELLRAHAIETFDTSVVRAHSPEGVSFWMGLSHTADHTIEPVITLTGSAGSVEWRHGEHCVLQNEAGRREERALPDIDETRERMFSDVLARLRDPNQFVCSAALAEAHTRFIESVHAAAEPVSAPRELISLASPHPDQRAWPVVHGLEDAMIRAHASGGTLAEAGFSLTAASH